jgi:hypothetical protein
VTAHLGPAADFLLTAHPAVASPRRPPRRCRFVGRHRSGQRSKIAKRRRQAPVGDCREGGTPAVRSLCPWWHTACFTLPGRGRRPSAARRLSSRRAQRAALTEYGDSSPPSPQATRRQRDARCPAHGPCGRMREHAPLSGRSPTMPRCGCVFPPPLRTEARQPGRV